MLPRRYAVLDPLTLGPALELQEGGLIVTYDTDGATLARNARPTIGLSAGRHQWEVVIYGDGSTPQTATTAAVGLVIAATPATVYPGGTATTVGYRPGDGACYQNGALIATASGTPLRSVMACVLDLVGPAPTFTLYVNRLLVRTFALPAGQTWFPAVSIGGDTAYAFSAFVNFGLRAFEEPALEGFRAGVFTSPQPLPTLRVGSQDWMTPATATPANIAYDGNITNAASFSIDKSVSFWPWGKEGGSTGYADIDLDNRGGLYTRLLSGAARNVRLVCKLVDRDAPGTPPVTIAATYVSRPEMSSLRRGRLRMRDAIEQLRTPAQRAYFLPYTPEGTRGRPLPISYGAVRSVEGFLVNEQRRSYVFTDRPMTQLGSVREKGDRLDPLAAPPDFNLRSDLRGIELNVEPLGKLVADYSSSGQPTIVGAPDIDILYGNGAMTSAVAGMPAGWFRSGNFLRATAAHVATSGGRLRTSTNGILPAAINASWDVRFRDLRYGGTGWLPIRKGCLYRLRWKVRGAYWPTRIGFQPFTGGWQVRGAGAVGDAGGMTTHFVPGDYSIDFRATCDGTLAWYGAGNIDPANNNGSTGPWWVEIDDVECVLKSVDVPEIYDGYGNFSSALPFWLAGDFASGASSAYGTVVSVEYPSPGLGCIAFSIKPAVGSYATRYCNYAELGPGVAYRIALSLAGSTANARLELIAWDTSTEEEFLLDTFQGSGSLYECRATVGSACQLLLRASSTNGAAATVKVSHVRVLDVTEQEAQEATNVPLSGITLHEFCKDVIESRAGLGPGAWVPADAQDIDADTGYVFGVHSREQVTNEALLRTPLDSFTASLTTDEQDRIRIVRLIDPETVPDEEIVLDIVVGVNTRGDLAYEPDLAPGLTAHAGCRRNWSVHSDSDFVEDFDPDTGITAAMRTRLKRKSQLIVSSAVPLHPLYEHARDAGPLETVLDVAAHAQAELDHVCGMFTIARGFYTVDYRYEGMPPPIRPRSIVRLTWEDAGVTKVRKLFVKRARTMPCSGSITIVGWGKAYVD